MEKDERDANLSVPFESILFHHICFNYPVDGIKYLDMLYGLFINCSPHLWCVDQFDSETLLLPSIHFYSSTEQ